MLDLAIGDGAISPALRARFDGWRKALPRPLDATSHVANRDGKLVLAVPIPDANEVKRSEERTSELQSLMRISYAVFCSKKKKIIDLTSATTTLTSTL